MKKLLFTNILGLAMYSLLTLVLSPVAFAQRVEPQVAEVEASARVRVESAKHDEGTPKKPAQWGETHSSWATSDPQHSPTLHRAAKSDPTAKLASPARSARSALVRMPPSGASVSQPTQPRRPSHSKIENEQYLGKFHSSPLVGRPSGQGFNMSSPRKAKVKNRKEEHQ